MSTFPEIHLSPAMNSLARKIVDARSRSVFLRPETAEVPGDLAHAMAVQESVMRMTGSRPLGWKVAVGPTGRPVAAPLIDIVSGPEGQFTFFPGCIIEIELCIRLRADLIPRPGTSFSRDDILDAAGAVFIGIEIVRSRLEFPDAHPFPLFLADNLGNAGYLLGPEADRSALDDVLGQRCVVKHEGSVVVDAPARHPMSDPLAPLLAYANEPSDFAGGLRRDQYVTTGALCGAIRLTGPGVVTAGVGDFAPINVRFT